MLPTTRAGSAPAIYQVMYLQRHCNSTCFLCCVGHRSVLFLYRLKPSTAARISASFEPMSRRECSDYILELPRGRIHYFAGMCRRVQGVLPVRTQYTTLGCVCLLIPEDSLRAPSPSHSVCRRALNGHNSCSPAPLQRYMVRRLHFTQSVLTSFLGADAPR